MPCHRSGEEMLCRGGALRRSVVGGGWRLHCNHLQINGTPAAARLLPLPLRDLANPHSQIAVALVDARVNPHHGTSAVRSSGARGAAHRMHARAVWGFH